jgi:hypothetical protein
VACAAKRAHLQAAQIWRAGAHLLLGALVEGDEAHRRRRQVPVLEQVAGAFGEHPGLAGTGGGDDPRRPGVVGDGGQLVRGEVGVGAVVGPERLQRAVGDGDAVDHGRTADR